MPAGAVIAGATNMFPGKKKESIMPAIAPAIVTGVAGLGSALIQGHGASRAAQAQQHGSDAALALERERDAEARRRYDMQWQAYQAEKTAYDARRRAILSHYGINLPDAPAAGPAPGAASAGVSTGQPGMAPAAPGGNMTIARFRDALSSMNGGPSAGFTPVSGPPAGPVAGAMGPAGAATAPAPGQTLADVSNWYKWRTDATA